MTSFTNTTPTNKALETSINSFGGKLDSQWDNLATLALKAVNFYWNKDRQSSHIIAIDCLLTGPNSNKNMAKAYRLYIKSCTPVLLSGNESHGKSNKKMAKAMVADMENTISIAESVQTGDDLKALLGTKKAAKKSTLASRIASLTKLLTSDDFDLSQVVDTTEAMEALLRAHYEALAAYDAELGSLDYDANDANDAVAAA